MLADYDITIEHRCGVTHQNADALRRLIADNLSSDDHTGARLDGSPVTLHESLPHLTTAAHTNLVTLQAPGEMEPQLQLQLLPNLQRDAVGLGLLKWCRAAHKCFGG